MVAKKSIIEQLTESALGRRGRALLIAIMVLVVLTVLQVSNLKQNTQMCELFNDCKLCNNDLHRMQIALSQSGLDEFKLDDHRLMVPAAKHSDYLQALAQQNAIPEEIKESGASLPSINPFLSRSQQLSIERAEKKHQVREMVLRLPFVEQAWFEMDKSDSHSAFEHAQQSAVISIRTPTNLSLTDQHVDTVKRMIGGAVAGLDSEAIVVIDLSAGFAHQESIDSSTNRQVRFQRIAFEQQRFYENQIREILKQYPGVEIHVHVEVRPSENQNTVASANNTVHASLPLTDPDIEFSKAGANGFATIADIEPSPKPPVQLVGFETAMAPNPLDKKVSVSIDVPQKLVYDLYGPPNAASSLTHNRADRQAALASDTESKFKRLQAEIVQKIHAILPKTNSRIGDAFPIAVNLIHQPASASTDWVAKTKQFASQNWPSAAVLALGLMLLSIVTRKPDVPPSLANEFTENGEHDVLSINSPTSNEANPTSQSDVRLSSLIEKDPDAAAKVIQAWIRDAA